MIKKLLVLLVMVGAVYGGSRIDSITIKNDSLISRTNQINLGNSTDTANVPGGTITGAENLDSTSSIDPKAGLLTLEGDLTVEGSAQVDTAESLRIIYGKGDTVEIDSILKVLKDALIAGDIVITGNLSADSGTFTTTTTDTIDSLFVIRPGNDTLIVYGAITGYSIDVTGNVIVLGDIDSCDTATIKVLRAPPGESLFVLSPMVVGDSTVRIAYYIGDSMFVNVISPNGSDSTTMHNVRSDSVFNVRILRAKDTLYFTIGVGDTVDLAAAHIGSLRSTIVFEDNAVFSDSMLGVDQIIVDIPAGSWDYTPTNTAPLDKDLGTNFGIRRQLFDATTPETLEAVFQLPDDLNNTDSIYIDLMGYASTAGAAGLDTVRWLFLEKEIADAKPWDVAYGIDTLDKMLTDGQDSINISSTGRLASDFSWVGGEFVMIRLVRLAGNASDVLATDYGLVLFTIRKK